MIYKQFLGDLFDNIIGAKEYDLLLSGLKDWEFEKSNDAIILKKEIQYKNARTQELNGDQIFYGFLFRKYISINYKT